MMNMTPVVKQLIIINILFFIGSQLVEVSYGYLPLFYPESNNFEIWQIFTHMFMHAQWPNFAHILFNMFALYSFGSALEHFWGGKKFLFFYISCGLGAALLHTGVNYLEIQSILNAVTNLNLSKSDLHLILNADYQSLFDANGKMIPGQIATILDKANCTQEQFNSLVQASSIVQSPVLGASGATYGLMTAFAFMFPNAQLGFMFIPVPVKAKYFVPVILAIDLFFGLKGSSFFASGSTGIAHFAHLGGALTGYLMMLYWKKNQFNDNRWN
ncbi:rhomboid family intramembrane serine protease [Flavobacterium chungangense]|uniref:Rhomboid family intramembrane serine protease n=1 Tax=Flavobacterium chungangense TaxID=554283 RepID=A0A6V6Z7G4_9FLAO|nr:rhomboid family intramembrane serine protease [Flavobacterium chungangense]CAD0007486.1 rhomboid family intramembrane serine protease [Flavobacterium chungangense]